MEIITLFFIAILIIFVFHAYVLEPRAKWSKDKEEMLVVCREMYDSLKNSHPKHNDVDWSMCDICCVIFDLNIILLKHKEK